MKTSKRPEMDLGCRLVVEYLSSMQETLGSILSTERGKKKVRLKPLTEGPPLKISRNKFNQGGQRQTLHNTLKETGEDTEDGKGTPHSWMLMGRSLKPTKTATSLIDRPTAIPGKVQLPFLSFYLCRNEAINLQIHMKLQGNN